MDAMTEVGEMADARRRLDSFRRRNGMGVESEGVVEVPTAGELLRLSRQACASVRRHGGEMFFEHRGIRFVKRSGAKPTYREARERSGRKAMDDGR